MPGATEPAPRPIVLICNHCRDPLQDFIEALRLGGLDALETTALAESCEIVDRIQPDVVVLSPLALTTGGVELELLENLQRAETPVPALLLVDNLEVLANSRDWRLPIRDFLVKPFRAEEAQHRVRLMLLYQRRHQALIARARELEGQISVDYKTGLVSERHFVRVLSLEWKRAQRHHNPLSLILVDVDDFKKVNDSTEYSFGDEVLRKVGDTLKNTVRETDFAARIGGDEFCLLLPQTTPKEAVQTAMRIRERIADTLVAKAGYSQTVTVSMGIDAYDGRSLGSVEMLRSHANHALKEAKLRGKNQVWLYTRGKPKAVSTSKSDKSKPDAASESGRGADA